MYNIIKTRYIWLSISGVLVLASIVVFILWGLRIGIDFTGGSLLEVNFAQTRPESSDVENVLNNASLDLGTVTVQPTSENAHIIKMRHVTNEERQKVLDALNGQYKEVTENRFETIGPSIGKELKRQAIISIILVNLAIILYITWAFRKVSKSKIPSYAYGICAIIALIHDIVIVVGVFSVLGYFLGVEVDSLFITALLTILGFSVHDTIVVYDRIREQLKEASDEDSLETIINRSINSTMARSINTSFSTVIVLLALYFFGGESIKYFVLALLIGIVSGTYSSIFVASPLLLTWHNIGLRRRS